MHAVVVEESAAGEVVVLFAFEACCGVVEEMVDTATGSGADKADCTRG